MAARLRFETGDPIYLEALLQFMTRDYFARPGDFWVLVSAAVMLEGLALYVVVAALCQKDPAFFDRALRMLVIGGAGLAVMSVVRLVEILLRNPAAIAAMRATSAGLRVSPQIGDSIAAGSYFALCWVAALGVAVAAPRGRLLWLGLGVPLLAALYLTGSRSVMAAMVAGLLVLGILVVIRRHGRMVRGVIGFASVAIVAMVVSYPWLIGRDIAGQTAARSLTIRRELAISGLRVIATRPVFGVGIDRFYLVAGSVASPELNAMWRGRKNPHNDFLRIGAELGLIGLALFLWILTGAARRTWLLLQQTHDPRLAGLAGGLVAFLVTSLVSNPLMMRDVSYAFWIALGLAVGQSPPSPAARETQHDTAPASASWRDRFVRWRWALGIALCGVLVFSVPFRSRQEIAALNVARVTYGLFDWMTDANGVRCRLSGPRATIFVDGDVRQVEIPLSGTLPSGLPQQVEVQLDGRLANRLSVGPDWQWLRIMLPRVSANPRRIDLTVTPSWVPADVIRGNHDRREFGVRVGEISVRGLDRR